MKRRILTLLILLTPLLAMAGEPKGAPRSQVRLGWGDMLFETLAFHPGTGLDGNVRSNFGYTGHIFSEYSYRLSKLISVGGELDFEGIFWQENGKPLNNYNLIAMPTIRFTYFEREWVSFYSGFGFGAVMAFDSAGNREFALAGNLNFFSVQVGKGPWSGTFSLGALNAIKNANRVYMVGSRLFSISLNYAW
jgi:hypothetical protein